MAYLALVRHGQSEWNALSLWTGWTDVHLTELGHKEAKQAGKALSHITFNVGFTSSLVRAQETLEDIKSVLHQDFPVTKTKALNERNYGDLTGKNKWKIKEDYGEDQFLKWRRGWNEPLPNGESLKNVYTRVIPYYTVNILPALQKGENVLIAAHGNSLRALVKYLDNVSDEDIPNLEIGLGEVYLYQISAEGQIINKKILHATKADIKPNK